MSILRWLVLFISVVVYRVWFPDVPPSSAIRLDYDLVIIVLVGMYRGQRVGAAIGWSIGFLAYAIDPDHMAWGALLGALLGWLIGHFRQRLFLEQLWSRLLVFAFAFLAYKLLQSILGLAWGTGPWYVLLFGRMIPTTVVDAVAGVVIAVFWERVRSTGLADRNGLLPGVNR